MEADFSRTFLDFSIKKLRQYASEIERCLARLTDDQVWTRRTENENAIGNLVIHLCGNVAQRTEAVSGLPDTRDRDREFSTRGGMSGAALTELLRTTIGEAVAVLEGVTAERLMQHVIVGEFNHSILESTYHMVSHFAIHTGQIIFATKLLTGADLGFYRPPAKSAR